VKEEGLGGGGWGISRGGVGGSSGEDELRLSHQVIAALC
jgi:hypothetical protein